MSTEVRPSNLVVQRLLAQAPDNAAIQDAAAEIERLTPLATVNSEWKASVDAEIERLRAALEAADSLYEDALRVASDVGLHEQDDLWAALEIYEDKRDPLKRGADETDGGT
jgi:hypothetical protein